MSPKKKKGRKERLKPRSFYGHDPKDVIRAFMQVDPEEVKKQIKKNSDLRRMLGVEPLYVAPFFP